MSRNPSPNKNVPKQSELDESKFISKVDESGLIEFDMISRADKGGKEFNTRVLNLDQSKSDGLKAKK